MIAVIVIAAALISIGSAILWGSPSNPVSVAADAVISSETDGIIDMQSIENDAISEMESHRKKINSKHEDSAD